MHYSLGISCFFHDSAACLLANGEIVAAAQEERFSRIKHDASFPLRAITYCLEEAGISVAELSSIAFYESIPLVIDRVLDTAMRAQLQTSDALANKLAARWGGGRADIEQVIRARLPDFNGPVYSFEHHESHAASAFYPSPFREAAILTIDGVGEWCTSQIAIGTDWDITIHKKMEFPNSLGLFYSAATQYLGFKVNSGEYKVMGLAPYGQPVHLEKLSDVIKINDDGSVFLTPHYFDFTGFSNIAAPAWAKLFGEPFRHAEDKLSQFHLDLAASIQVITETAMLGMAKEAKRVTGARHLTMAGGVALNCVGNGKICAAGIFDEIWTQPASGDAGNALGAAYLGWLRNTPNAPLRLRPVANAMQEGRLGPAFSDAEVIDFLDLYDLPYKIYPAEQIAEKTVELVLAGKVVGMFDGRMEFGPRALGARSIIGNPQDPKMQSTMNLRIKFRESFRPFAPIVLEEHAPEWFELDQPSPYMLIVAPVKANKRLQPADTSVQSYMDLLRQIRSPVPSVTHVDYSARIQTVSKESGTLIRSVIERFHAITGVPMLINTSFNLRSEPIVCTPWDAYRCMMRSAIDAIVFGSILVLRDEQPKWNEKGDWREKFVPD